MSLDWSLVRTVGFVFREGRPAGTCFLVRVQSELRPDRPDWDHGYLVTAAHVVPTNGVPSEVWMGTGDGELVRGFTPDWQWAPGEDIAVAPWLPAEDARRWSATRMYADTTESMGIVAAYLGAPVYYVGLLEPVASMANRGQPMVRSGSLGALDVHDVTYGDKRTTGEWTAYVAHLIDCRSYGGFSGSPVFLASQYPGPATDPLPVTWRDAPGAKDLGTMYHFAALFGMLVGFGSDAGVGIVIAIERIQMVLNTEDLKSMRREEDKKRSDREKARPPDFEAISAEPRDEPVSLAPLAFEDALRGLLSVEPPERDGGDG